MSRQIINLYHNEEKFVRVRDGFALQTKGRFAKLQQKLWDWGLKKGLIVYNYRETISHTRVMIDSDDLFDRIYKHWGDVISRSDPKMVIMGPNTWCELMGRKELLDYTGGPISMTATGEQRLKNGHRRMFELPVKIISSMEGCVIL